MFFDSSPKLHSHGGYDPTVICHQNKIRVGDVCLLINLFTYRGDFKMDCNL